MRCPVCESIAARRFLSREDVPVHQNLVLSDRQSAVSSIRRGDLRLACCPKCGFVFNTSFEPSKLEYGSRYDNSQECSPYFAAHVDGLVERITRSCRGSINVVEVGCGKGTFLRRLVEGGGGRVRGHGFDPSYEGPADQMDGRLRFDRSFYGLDCEHERADVVICRHVIEHVDDPMLLLGSIRRAMDGSPHARLYLETPCVEWILENGAVWDFFYEHCSYFSPPSMRLALHLAGMQIAYMGHLFGGQYLWVEATVAGPDATTGPGADRIAQLADPRWGERFLAPLQKSVAEMASKQVVALWGAGAKGATFAHLCDPTAELLACVVDLNPRKQGQYVAGTGHPIIDYHELSLYGVRRCLLMNPNYEQETRLLLEGTSSGIELVNITGRGFRS
jgi:SAM-dependent methyltransferase